MAASDQRGDNESADFRIKINPVIKISAKHLTPSIEQSVELDSAAQVMQAGKAKTTGPDICCHIRLSSV
ncbi:MAG: hypothetical protein CVV06_03305 [Gammaproteobacteria bacterium HGW-Gammaproteobacteria-10]|nr:MAG: hypothetical protein CVV06_03305 [Gammaproteobacteria bacterium HGW-Gammaproteobacteria-10]